MDTQVFNKYFLPFAEALELKKLGFSEQCFQYYTSEEDRYNDEGGCDDFNMYAGEGCSIPSYAQAFDFFREKFKLEGVVISWTEGGKTVWYFSSEPVGKPNIYRGYICTADTHDIAQYECIKDLIRQVKEKNNGTSNK
jgi:hypothetical protein